MLDSLLSFSDKPAWLVLVVIVSTFTLEDLAIIGAAMLAASGRMDPVLAFAATCTGMFIGDTALYIVGRWALVWPWLKKKCQHDMIRRQIDPLQEAPVHQLALIRCMPGLRTFGYIACGLAKVPGWTFILANIVSIVAWAGVLFGSAFWLGRQYAEEMHELMWWLLPVAVFLFVFGQRRARKRAEAELAAG
ncbi:DedA family protein [Parathalassolituus penaei]|uniref:DedA family protein n=1 Tax=Parathalassolituus penaei TaxID=2997323 RepID=A0A9X3IR65_9GAMM|nr:DedA family protein [Parathalassolituus penaei]MCY0963905.1 DedA family protein [Parathalassolituus penaei]